MYVIFIQTDKNAVGDNFIARGIKEYREGQQCPKNNERESGNSIEQGGKRKNVGPLAGTTSSLPLATRFISSSPPSLHNFLYFSFSLSYKSVLLKYTKTSKRIYPTYFFFICLFNLINNFLYYAWFYISNVKLIIGTYLSTN